MSRLVLASLSSSFLLAGLLVSGAAWAGDAAAGKTSYDMYCATCHGATGVGDGPAAAALQPAPRNFTDATLMSEKTDEQLLEVIRNGSPGTGMTAWGSVLSEADQANILAYIRSLSATE